MKTRSTTILATIITSLVAFMPVSNALAQGGTWTSIASMPATPVDTATASGVALAGNFYVIDSGSGYGIPLPLKVYDPVADSWSLKAADPVLRGQTAVGVMNNKIYVAEGWGGQFGSDSNAATKALEIYDPATDTWAAGTPSLIARGLSATAVIGGKLYVAGGTATGYANFVDLEIYDPLADSWSLGAPLPNQLTSAGGAALNGKFYVLGGYAGPSAYDNQITAAVHIYDPVLNVWIMGTPMPTGRANMVVGVINGKLCVTSGNVLDGSKDGSTVVYDSTTDSWSTDASEPTPRANAAAAVLDNKLFVAGGNTDDTSGTSTAEAFSPGGGTFANISTRMSVGSSDNALIGGFIITGTQAKKVIVRAIGPSLPISGALADPILELHDSNDLTIATNDNWRDSPDPQAIIDSTLPPSNDMESAIIMALDPAAYTAVVRGVSGTTGVGLVEIYDLDLAVDSKLANISTRGFVQTEDNVMIGGVIILGINPTSTLVRAIGPSLPVSGALQDPTLELHDSDGVTIAVNDNWRSDQEADIIATSMSPTNDSESAILATLVPGAYTAIVRGTNGTTGVALVEAYQLDQ